MWAWLKRFYHQMASPPHFFRWAGRLAPYFMALAALLIIGGTLGGLIFAPPDYQQGDAFRIIYVHVPSAYISLMAYTMLAICAAVGFIWRIKLAHAVAVSIAPIGAWFTFLALMTGAIWGKPMWGTYWQWGDARMVSELVLLFLYLGYLALRAAFDDRDKADRISAVLAVVGVVNVPIIHYSVNWWATLHQGPTISKIGSPSITADMLTPLLAMIAGFTFLFGWLVLRHTQSEVLEREAGNRWTTEL
ncbi:MAG: heme ABC transporter permease CcmC [Gammaproteobacteria bacterium]|nr:heme ABC transporter permease CcmC [Gammaproteobacteria bacterium]